MCSQQTAASSAGHRQGDLELRTVRRAERHWAGAGFLAPRRDSRSIGGRTARQKACAQGGERSERGVVSACKFLQGLLRADPRLLCPTSQQDTTKRHEAADKNPSTVWRRLDELLRDLISECRVMRVCLHRGHDRNRGRESVVLKVHASEGNE
jgi:hypothetical protein